MELSHAYLRVKVDFFRSVHEFWRKGMRMDIFEDCRLPKKALMRQIIISAPDKKRIFLFEEGSTLHS